MTDACSFAAVALLTSTLTRNYDRVRPPKANDSDAADIEKNISHGQMLLDAFRYLLVEPKVLAACAAKACGALTWSAADLLQVRFSNMDSMNAIGDQQLTLGVLYSMVGLGCYLGPVSWNGCTPQKGEIIFSRIVFAFANFTIAYFITIFAPNIFVLMMATATRAFGAGTLWTYSTLLIQIWAPDKYKGRLFAFESFLFCSVSIIANFICAVLFDIWDFDERDISLIMCLLACFLLFVWFTCYFVLFWSEKKSDVLDHIQLQPVQMGKEETIAHNDVSKKSIEYSSLPAAEEEDVEYAVGEEDEMDSRRGLQRSTSV